MITPCITRSGRDDAIHAALRAAICVPTWRYLWIPTDGFNFMPALCNTIFGDGRALFAVTTINSRPQFYVVRCDSGWDESNWSQSDNFGDHVEDIRWAIEEQFGSARLDSEEDDPALVANGKYPWPALDDEGGTSWGRMDWPKMPGIKTHHTRGDSWRGHNILAREYAVEDPIARWVDDGGPVIERQFY